MKFLSQIGKSIIAGATYVAKFDGWVPMSSIPIIPKLEDDIAKLSNIIVEVEVLGQTLNVPGPDKLKAAIPLIAQVILKSSILTNHSISDQTLFIQGCTKVAGGFADILNSLKAK